VAVGVFTNDESLTELSVFGLQVSMAAFPVIGYQIVTSNFFQSIGMAGKAILLSLTRQVIFLIPCILLLPLLFQTLNFTPIWGVWWSLPLCDALAAVLAAIILNRDMRKFRV
jgi:Na+-driven multidrug efflux pump